MAQTVLSCSPQNNMDCHYNQNWLQLEQDSGSTPPLNNFILVQDRIDSELYEYIMNVNPKENNPVINKLIQFRESYFDRKNISPALRQLVSLVSSISNVQELALVVKLFIQLQIPTLFSFGVVSNFRPPSIYTLCIGDMPLTVESSKIFEDNDQESIIAFAEMLWHLHEMIVNDWNYQNTDTHLYVKNVCAMEMLFAPVTLSFEEGYDPSYTHNSVFYQDFLGQFDVHDFWSTVIGHMVLHGRESSQPITFENPRLLTQIRSFLTTINEDPERLQMIKDYLVHCICREYGIYTNVSQIFELVIPFRLDPKQLFIGLMTDKFGYELQKRFDQQNLDPEKVSEVKKMFEQMRDYCIYAFHHSDLFSPESLEEAIRKVTRMQLIVGSQDYSIDLKFLPELSEDFYGNMMRLSTFYHLQTIKFINQPVQRNILSIDNSLYSFYVNAYYDSSTNSIYLPTAILNDAFFNLEDDPIDRFGGLGVIIGHEISHSFDNIGSQFDHCGHLKNWWTREDSERFRSILQKVNDHYANLHVNGLPVNPMASLSENVADIGGIKLALRTYLVNYQPNLDLSNLTIDEATYLYRFFKKWTYTMRDFTTPRITQYEIENDVHAPSILRVNAPFAHLNEYHLIYQTKPGQSNYLPPEKRSNLLDIIK